MDILSPFSVNILLIRSKHPNMKTTCTSASPSGQTVLGRENIVLEGILAAAEREFPQTVHIPVLGCSATNTFSDCSRIFRYIVYYSHSSLIKCNIAKCQVLHFHSDKEFDVTTKES